MTLREKRHREVTNTLSRTIAQRDGCISNLVRYEARIKALRKQCLRLERAMARPDTAKPEPAPQPAAPVPAPAPVVSDVTDILVSELPIPDFLDRTTKSAKERDRVAREAILAEQADRKKAKTRNRIEEMKAKQSGVTKRMPLTGKAAAEFLRQGA